MAKKHKEPQQQRVQKHLDNVFAEHRVTVLQQTGLFRHYECRNPRHRNYWFGVVTWPHWICIYGDLGTHVLTRTEDMLPFVANSDPAYLCEKVEAFDRVGGQKIARGNVTTDRFMFCVLAVRWLYGRIQCGAVLPAVVPAEEAR